MEVKDIRKIAVLGGGVIGSSWVIQFAMHGLDVNLRDVDEAALEKCRKQIEANLDSLIEADAMTEEKKQEILSRIHMMTSAEEALRGVQFIQENGPERVEIKQSILADVDAYAPEDAIYASSTSGLLISDISAKCKHPERCISAHPYNPPHLIPLVELAKSEKTDPAVLQTAYDFYQSVGKESVILNKECPGFIANRLQMAVYREMVDLVNRGVCSAADVDKAMVFGPGLRWAIYGQSMVLELANPKGLTGFFDMLGTTANKWLEDMADWKTLPEDWTTFQEGVNEEMRNFPDFMGHDPKGCAEFRDRALIDILKIHHKL